ncbi:50S ribosomal protein L32e [Candidatus Woesearchaeota archaeon]|nr:50S ribosomal protein L32e [Candidatus Woesearchaeota archaeon]
MADIKKLLEIRNGQRKKRPRFVRQDWHKKKRLALVWRKPKGMDSKLRKHMHGHGHLPTRGYGSPALVRGMHKSGLVPILVAAVNQVDAINGKTHGIIISATVGNRKRIDIITKASSKSIRVLNIKDGAKFVQSVKDELAKRKHAKTTHKVPEKAVPKAKPEPQLSQEEKKAQEKREAEKVIASNKQ